MSDRIRGRQFAALFSALLLAVVLVSQTGTAAHVHGGELQSSDCLQCQLNGSQALPLAPLRVPALLGATVVEMLPLALAPSQTTRHHYARGPPISG